MAHREIWRINSTSTVVVERNGWRIVVTGGWFDLWCGNHHMRGSLDILELAKIIG